MSAASKGTLLDLISVTCIFSPTGAIGADERLEAMEPTRGWRRWRQQERRGRRGRRQRQGRRRRGFVRMEGTNLKCFGGRRAISLVCMTSISYLSEARAGQCPAAWKKPTKIRGARHVFKWTRELSGTVKATHKYSRWRTGKRFAVLDR